MDKLTQNTASEAPLTMNRRNFLFLPASQLNLFFTVSFIYLFLIIWLFVWLFCPTDAVLKDWKTCWN